MAHPCRRFHVLKTYKQGVQKFNPHSSHMFIQALFIRLREGFHKKISILSVRAVELYPFWLRNRFPLTMEKDYVNNFSLVFTIRVLPHKYLEQLHPFLLLTKTVENSDLISS